MRSSRISAASVGVAATLRLGIALALLATAAFAWARSDTPLVEAVDQTFTISVGSTVSNGSPLPGAGNIEGAGDRDIYHFSATAGQNIYFDGNPLGGSAGSIRWTLRDPSSNVIFQNLFISSDGGAETMPATGNYQITVHADASATGTYNFRITNIPPPDTFTIAIGDTVSNGVPGPGAGNIEVAGASNVYSFSATAGQQVYFDGNPLGGSASGVRWTLRDPSNNVIFQNFFISSDGGAETLPVAGTYTITTLADLTQTGTYNFRITNIPPPDTFTIAIGDTVSNGVPGAGAGNIEVAGASNVYSFSADRRTAGLLRRQPARRLG